MMLVSANVMPIDKTMATLGKQLPTNCEWNTGNVTDKVISFSFHRNI